MFVSGQNVFYVGGFKRSITVDKIYRYVDIRGPRVSQVMIYPCRRSDGVTIRLNIESDSNCHLVEEPEFWPDHVVCKPWVTRGSSKRSQRYRNSNSAYQNYEADMGYAARYNRYDGIRDTEVD